jgi:hypothetical protein
MLRGQVLMDPSGGTVATTSAAVEHEGRLFLGNLGGDYVSVLDLRSPEVAEAIRNTWQQPE